MFFRVILAAIIGGALAFVGGFVGHGPLNLMGRHLKDPAEQSTLKETFGKHFPDSNVYYFPSPKMHDPKLSKEEQEKAKAAFKEEFDAGRSGFVVPGPKNEDFNFIKMISMEAVTNVVAAFIAAMIVALSRPGLGFVVRWFI